MPWQVEVVHFNVNSGDSALLLATDGTIQKAILIDGGTSGAGKNVVFPWLQRLLGNKTLDAIVVTHYDKDHYGGIKFLLTLPDFIKTFIKDNSDGGIGTILYDNGDNVKGRQCPYTSEVNNLNGTNQDYPNKLVTRIAAGTDASLLLGQDFMWLKQIPDSGRTTESVATLRTKDAVINATKPALYCIAINRKVLQHPQMLGLVPGDTSQQNMNSIALVLVSPDSENKICYYMAGDLTEELEDNTPLPDQPLDFGVSKWLAQTINGQYRVPGMKLSHHGSQNSTPDALIKALNPGNIVISAGGNPNYRHPSPMIIVYLYLYEQYLNAFTVMGTNCPYYLAPRYDSIPWAGSNNYRTHEAITNLMQSFFPNSSSGIEDEISSLFNTNNVCNLENLRRNWNDIGTPKTDENRFPQDLSPDSVNVNIKPITASLLTEQAPVNNGPQIIITKKRKAPEPSALFLTVASFSETSWTITSSNVVPAGDIPLVQGSDFDVFVSSLPTGAMTLSACTINATNTVITGTISSDVDDIFYQSGVSSVMISLTGTKTTTGQYNFSRDDVAFTFTFALKLLNANQDIVFNGALQMDNTLKMTLPASPAITTNPIFNGQFCGFLSNTSDDEIVTSLGGLFSMIVSTGVLLDPVNTQLIFDPTNNAMKLTLVSQLSSVNLFEKLNLSNLRIAFTNNTHVLNSTTLMQSSKCEFNATLSLALTTGNFSSGITITLFPTGVGSFSIATTGGAVENLINSFSQELLDFDCAPVFNDLNSLGINLNEMQLDIMIHFDVIQKKILSISVSSDISAFGYTFSTILMLPNTYLCGGLSANMPAAASSMSTLIKAHNIPEPSPDFTDFPLTSVSFAVSPSSSYYNFTADLGDQNTSVWKFNSQINLEQLAISLTKNGADIQASLTAFLAMGSQLVSVTGTYQSDGTNSDWSFSATISTLNLSDIASYVGVDISNFPIQDLVLTNITSTIDVTNKTFAISAKTTFGNLTFVVNDEKTLFSLALPLVNSKVSAPVVGNLPSMIDSLQLLYVSQAIQDDADPIIILFQQSQALLLPSHGLTAGLQIIAQFDPALGQGNTPVSLSVWQPTPTPTQEPSEYATTLAVSATPSNTQHSTLWISINQTFGPLSLARLGISVSQGDFCLLFDASVQLGGLTLELQGLGLGFSLSDLTALPSISLSGLGLDYSTPTLSIEGDFLANPSQGGNAYQGSALLSMENFMAAAIGAYTQTSTGSPSIFVYTRIDVPLGGPPFFYVMGFSGGFGYNMNLRIPTQNEVLNFPLVAGAVNPNPVDLPSDMATMMTTLTTGDNPWLTTQAGAEWFAIGINFSTFELIYTQALIIAEFGSNPLFSLIGLSSMQLPKATDYPVAYAEMEMEAVYNMNLGVLCMTALLSPSSYVLTPDCHLTGGFAFYTWFKNQVSGALAGDFVVTLGGYHPAFVPPAWYPNVPRLGFNWQVSDQVTISGDAYFALTPSCAMMGGALNASFNAGNLRAWFNAYADFLINWHPFYYTAAIGVSVGASYTLNLWFCTTTLSVEIGATLNLAGPPTHGNVYVDWYIISFSIPFGQQITTTPSVTWTDFCQLLPSSSASTTSSSVNLNRIVVSSGLLQQDPSASTWIVRPHGFSFYTLSAIPATTITFNGAPVTDSEGKTSPDNEVNIKPMNLSSITHTHGITVNTPPGTTWTYTINETNVPDALWGVPGEPSTLAVKLLSNAWTGVTVSAPLPSVGATPGPIATTVFGDIPVNNAPLPLNVNSTQSIPQESANSRQTMVSTIATSQTNAARNQVASSLSALGLFNTVSLDSMTQMAQNINKGQCFTESPLQRTFPSTVSRASL